MDRNFQTIQSSYIMNLRKYWTIQFPSMPESFSDSKTPNWNSHEIVGRWTPIRGYSSSGPRTISILLTFYSSVDSGDNGNTERNVLDQINKLRSLTYPNYDGYAYSPDPVLLRLGKMVFMKCIVTAFDTNWRAPWDLDEEVSMVAEVSMTFEEVNMDPLDCLMVERGDQSKNRH